MPPTLAHRADLAATREALVQGACVLVATDGLRALTVERIIRQSRLSRRTFYLYFSSVDALLDLVYERVCDELLDAVEQAVAGAQDPFHQVRAGIDAYLAYQLTGGRLVAELQAEAASPGSRLWPARARALDRLGTVVERRVLAAGGPAVHPHVWRTLHAGMEALVIHLRQGSGFGAAEVAHAAGVMRPLFLAALLSLPHFPRAPPPEG